MPPFNAPPPDGLIQQWLNQLPIATSLWQLSQATLPSFIAGNTPWLKQNFHLHPFEAFCESLHFSAEKDKQAFQLWWQTPAEQPFTANVSIIPNNMETAELSTLDEANTQKSQLFKLTLACFSSQAENPTVFVSVSLVPLCEAETLGQAHHEFLSVLSHEFRTPLTSIQGFADTLLHFGSKLPEAQQQRCLTLISDQTKRLNRMVENLLSASKLEAQNNGHQQAKPVVLHLLLQKVLQTIAGKGHPPHQVTLRLPQNMPPLWGNPDTLEQILLNLVDNAFKYSPANSTVAIAADVTTHQAESQASLTIQDEGIGLTPQQQDQLFTKFYRASNPLPQAVEGTGLGLYITKVLVQQLGGSIKVAHSTPNEGTCFEVILPLATTQRIQQKMPLLLQGAGEAPTHD